MTRKLHAIGLICLAAAACTNSDGTMGQRGSIAWYNQSNSEQKKVYFTEVCSGYGFKGNTPEMAQCIANEHRSMRSARSSLATQMAMSGPRTCTGFGNTMTCY